jgi:hypothetical protein
MSIARLVGTKHIVVGALGVSSGGGPTPVLDITLTSTLPSGITFTRSGARNYINAGVVTPLATGLPAFESWGGVSRGLAIEPGFTNLLTHSQDPTQGVYGKGGLSGPVAGDSLSGSVLTQLYRVNATATSEAHSLRRDITPQASGTRQTITAYVKQVVGATTYSVKFRLSNIYNNDGQFVTFRLDGNYGAYPLMDTAVLTNGNYGYRLLADGLVQIWVTGTWVSTGDKEMELHLVPNLESSRSVYTGLTTDAYQVAAFQWATTNGPAGYVATGAATASQAAESAIFNDTSWLTTTQGTFVVEHDCWDGPVVGSGANTVLGAAMPGKTAIAWSGSTSDLVNNGGASTTGVQPTFSGSDIRLLATTGTTNTGHIKSIKFYNTRLTVEQLQDLTAPVVASTANPGTLRGMSTKNRLPSGLVTLSGTKLSFASRFNVPIGINPAGELVLDWPNICFPEGGVNPIAATGNDLYIDEAYLERVTDVAESVQIKKSGAGTFTIPNGANTTFLTDAIAPSAFTGMTTQVAGLTDFYIRLRGHVTTSGHRLPAGRSKYDTGAYSIVYDPAATTIPAISGTGPLSFTGGSPDLPDYGYSPILIGRFVSGDPKTTFTTGDSIVEGITSSDHQGPGLFIKKACMALGIPNIELSKGGYSQIQLDADLIWAPYMKYARILIDEMGTNNQAAMLAFWAYYTAAKETYNMDKVGRVGLFPSVSGSTDSYVTEANQTVNRASPQIADLASAEWLRHSAIDFYHYPVAERGVNQSKWKVNGTPNYATADGLHPSVAADDLMKAEFQPVLDAITVT